MAFIASTLSVEALITSTKLPLCENHGSGGALSICHGNQELSLATGQKAGDADTFYG